MKRIIFFLLLVGTVAFGQTTKIRQSVQTQGILVPSQGGTGIDNSTRTLTLTTNGGTIAFPTASTVQTFPTTTQTIAGLTEVQTFTNKRNTKRQLALAAPPATPTVNTDSYDIVHITGLTNNITSFTTNLTGTPVAGDYLLVDITDDGTPRTISWGANFESSPGETLPAGTAAGTRLDIIFSWNQVTSKWRCIGSSDVSNAGASDIAYGATWDGITTVAGSKNSIYDYLHIADPDDNGKINVLDLGAGIPKTSSGGVVSLAAAADVVGLFSSCSGTQYLGADGACHTAVGSTGPFPWGGSETGHGNSSYTILSTDKVVFTNAAFTGPQTWTLPAASAVSAGYAISIIDRQGTLTTTNLLTITRAASDIIYPPNASTYIMSGAYQGVTLESDGVSKWHAISVQPGLGGGSTTGYFAQMSWTAGVWAGSLYTLPTAIGTNGKILQSNGTNAVFSGPTWPTSAAASGKIVRDNGTNFVESTAQYPDTAGTTGNVLTSDGTNWISSAPAAGAASIIRSVNFSFQDLAGAALTAQSAKLVKTVPYSGTITGWSISQDSATTITFKWWKKANGTTIPTVANVINTSGLNTSSQHTRSSTVTDFGANTTVTAGDMFVAEITGTPGGATAASVELEITSP